MTVASEVASATRLKITRIEAIPLRLPLARAYRISQGADETGDILITRVETDGGIVGWGEACAQPYFSGDSIEGIKSAIDHYLAPALEGHNPTDIAGAIVKMDRVMKHNPYAKAAIDFALWDLTGKALGLPVYTLLGGLVRDRVPANQGIGISTPQEMAAQAVEAVENGYSVVKLKVGIDEAQDLVNVRAVRQAIGDRAKIRVDANQAYPTDVAIKLLRRMDDEVDLELVEQPVAQWDFDGMARVCAALDVPILADESLFGLEDALKLVRMSAADLFNIKLMKVGGLYRARQVAAVGEAAGIRCLVGSMGESGPGRAADVHFGAATINLTYPSAFGRHRRVASIITEVIEAHNGYAEVPHKPGLGMEIDQEVLQKYRTDR
jgi:muconate/chloromuconate cycloisomerase